MFDLTGRAKWDAWDGISKRFAEGGPEAAAEHYVEIARSLGWGTEWGGDSDACATSASDEEHRVGGKDGAMGVSVSVMKPPEGLGEDDLHSLAIAGNVQKMGLLLNDPQVDINERDEYVSTSFSAST